MRINFQLHIILHFKIIFSSQSETGFYMWEMWYFTILSLVKVRIKLEAQVSLYRSPDINKPS